MTFQQELASWNPFAKSHTVHPIPEEGASAPSSARLNIPRPDNKPMIIIFLRHCGCPFAEKAFKTIREAASERSDVQFIAVSHSDRTATDHWLQAVGGAGSVEVVVDHEREIFGAYGLGLSSFLHTLGPTSMSALFKLGNAEQIWNRPTESGSRWQTAGMFSIDADGKVRYTHVAQSANDMGDVQSALSAVQR